MATPEDTCLQLVHDLWYRSFLLIVALSRRELGVKGRRNGSLVAMNDREVALRDGLIFFI